MKYKCLPVLFLFLAISFTTYAQRGFKEGYIVNNRHERIDCLIRNVGNEESTMNYEFRLGEDKPIEKIELTKIEEFGIDDELKCIRALISLDVSRRYIKSIQDTTIQWDEGHAYLKTLVEGEFASLFSYYFEKESLFFYSKDGNTIEPLVHKEYSVGTTPIMQQQILRDNTYQEQLKQQLSCGTSENAHKVSYTKKDLIKYFIDYHTCKNSDYYQFESTHIKKGKLFIKPGIHINNNQLTIKNPVDAAPRASFVKENSVGYGLELEYMIPFNNYAWSFFAEGNYLSYNADKIALNDNQNASLYDGYMIDYKTIEMPFGINYNVNMNQNQRLYVKVAFAPHFILSESYIAFNESNKESFSSSSRFLVGLGYSFQNLGVELRYYTPQNITQNIYKRGSDFTQLSMKLSYSFQLFGERGVR